MSTFFNVQYISGKPVHTYIKVTVTGTGLEDFREPVFVRCFNTPGIQEVFDTFALPVIHVTLPDVSGNHGNDGKIQAR